MRRGEERWGDEGEEEEEESVKARLRRKWDEREVGNEARISR